MAPAERQTAVAVFADRTHAEYAVDALLRGGFAPEQIGVVVPDAGPVVEPPALDPGTKAGEGAATGAVGGAVLGSLLGAALTTVLLPGIGPVIAAGLLAGVLGGAGAGAAGGGILGALIGLNIPEEEAHHHTREFHSGRTLVTVRAGPRYDEAVAILRSAQDTPEAERHDWARSRLSGTAGESPGTGSAAVPEP